jgi:6-phosphofructokinase 1
MVSSDELKIRSLGKPLIPSQLDFANCTGEVCSEYVSDRDRVSFEVKFREGEDGRSGLSMEKAGPREQMYFDPAQTRVGIVTCGGVSPGLNNVIRSIHRECLYKYQIAEVYGFRFGFKGLNPDNGFYPKILTGRNVEGIHKHGGCILGSSRGGEDPRVMVETLDEMGINILFCVGGDGTMKGAHALWEEIERRNKKIAIVGVPKTIDNDISYVYKTFGFDTAVGKAREVLDCAHAEAACAPNGIGLVKLMGRDSGFIAANATLANLEVNFCLVPEVPFDLDGKGAFLDLLEQRVKKREHAVIVVAEGAGQELMKAGDEKRDASGNVLHEDIGEFLKERIEEYFAGKEVPISLKYIDPSYIIRSVPANASDCIFCDMLARNAVHAGMGGKTDLVIGLWHGVYVHVPIPMATRERKRIRPAGSLWSNVLEVTGQPMSMKHRG